MLRVRTLRFETKEMKENGKGKKQEKKIKGRHLQVMCELHQELAIFLSFFRFIFLMEMARFKSLYVPSIILFNRPSASRARLCRFPDCFSAHFFLGLSSCGNLPRQLDCFLCPFPFFAISPLSHLSGPSFFFQQALSHSSVCFKLFSLRSCPRFVINFKLGTKVVRVGKQLIVLFASQTLVPGDVVMKAGSVAAVKANDNGVVVAGVMYLTRATARCAPKEVFSFSHGSSEGKRFISKGELGQMCSIGEERWKSNYDTYLLNVSSSA